MDILIIILGIIFSIIYLFIVKSISEHLKIFINDKNINKEYPPKRIIAVDFDGTLCCSKYPEANIDDISITNSAVIDYIRREHNSGSIIILWTCRTGNSLKKAIEFCKSHKIPIDYINENYPGLIKQYNADCRKISADVYIDDKAWNPFHRGG